MFFKNKNKKIGRTKKRIRTSNKERVREENRNKKLEAVKSVAKLVC